MSCGRPCIKKGEAAVGAACDTVVLCLSSHQNSGAKAPPILHLMPVLVLKRGRRRWGRPVMPSFCACPRIKIAGRSIGDLAPYACPCVKKGEAVVGGRPVIPSFCACPRIKIAGRRHRRSCTLCLSPHQLLKREGMVGLRGVPAIISAARKENSPAGAGEGYRVKFWRGRPR